MQQHIRTLKQISCVGIIAYVLTKFGEVGTTHPPFVSRAPPLKFLSENVLNRGNSISAVDYSISLKFGRV